jgi:hypothetical protein
MGFFDEIETPVDQIPTGFGLPIGVYPVLLSDIKNHVKEDGTKSTIVSFVVDTVNDEDQRSGKEDIWLTKPVRGDKNASVYASIGKQWMLAIGVPLSVMSEEGFELVDQKENLVGVSGVLKVTAGKKGYTKKEFTLDASPSGVSDMAGTEPANKNEVSVDTSDWG